jgi:hypothetical protein
MANKYAVPVTVRCRKPSCHHTLIVREARPAGTVSHTTADINAANKKVTIFIPIATSMGKRRRYKLILQDRLTDSLFCFEVADGTLRFYKENNKLRD